MREVPLRTRTSAPMHHQTVGHRRAPVHGKRPLWPSAGRRSTASEVGSLSAGRPRPFGSVGLTSDGFPPGGPASHRRGRKPTPASGARPLRRWKRKSRTGPAADYPGSGQPWRSQHLACGSIVSPRPAYLSVRTAGGTECAKESRRAIFQERAMQTEPRIDQ